MAKKHVDINDLQANAIEWLSVDDLTKLSGGVTLVSSPYFQRLSEGIPLLTNKLSAADFSLTANDLG